MDQLNLPGKQKPYFYHCVKMLSSLFSSCSSVNNPAMNFPTPSRQLHWSYLCFLNLWLLLSPSQLCAEYAMDTIPPISSLTDPRNLLTLATFAALISMLCYGMSGREGQRRKVLFALCLMVIPFIPASNLFFPVGFVIAERVLYIPSMGFCMLVGYGMWCVLRKYSYSKGMKIFTKLAFLYLLLLFSMKTVVRNRDWMSNATLYPATIKTYPNNVKMLNFHATINLLPSGEYELAEKLYRYALGVEPRYIALYRNLAEYLRRMGRADESIKVGST